VFALERAAFALDWKRTVVRVGGGHVCVRDKRVCVREGRVCVGDGLLLSARTGSLARSSQALWGGPSVRAGLRQRVWGWR